MRLALGCDEAAYDLKLTLKAFLEQAGHQVTDFGTFDAAPVLYPDIAEQAARSIVRGDNERGILLCGTGIGMAISANKIRGIRAAQCHDTYSAERAQKSNDAQVITIGARVVGPELAKAIVAAYLQSSFQPGSSSPKVARILDLEKVQAAG
ncbi:MAG TPA: ribose 5-phosphate isomerase B [Devosia sp.]|jgi:ribose 5-phosphate isomerase B|nr:ribose 5-phosphate isomerase B [Devosia sp.]